MAAIPYPTTGEEIKAYLEVTIVIGILPAPAQNMYWLKQKLFHPFCIEQKFSRTKFEMLQRYFHVVDTTAIRVETIMARTNWLCASLIGSVEENICKGVSSPQEVSIKEAMIGFSS